MDALIRRRRARPPHHQGGQVIVLFALSMVAMLAMASLVFDGAAALLARRQIQDAADAASLAAANVIGSGTSRTCSLTSGPPPGIVRTDVRQAALDSIATNLPGFNTSSVTVTCPDGWSNTAVQVQLNTTSPSFFGGIVGVHGMAVTASGTAMNGGTTSTKFSVVELDNGNIGWPTGYRGCPSVLFSGSNTVIFDGALQVDSACPASSGGALGTNGNSATVQLNNGATINLVGGYQPGALTITPTPLTGQPPVIDPLRNLPAIPYASWPNSLVRAANQTTINSGSQLLEPGIYIGGIAMKNQAVAYLHPGIYVMEDDSHGNGGFTIGAQNKVYSLPASKTSTTDSTWATDCTSADCGVLLYSTGMACASGSPKDQISVGAGATVKLRPYVSTADGTSTNDPSYQNLLLWQDKDPRPSGPPDPNCYQPPVSLSGGGQINISGTVYAPSAIVQMGGTSGGSGGNEVDVTLQFISWDLQFSGNIGFHFYYQSEAFAKPTDYGLIK